MENRHEQVGRVSLAAALAALTLAIPVATTTEAGFSTIGVLPSPPVELDDGDVVFRTGVDALGRMVLNYGDRPRFSHVGMVVRMNGDTLVAHALPSDMGQGGGVQLQRLASFSSPLRASDVGYYRPSGITPAQRLEMRRYLLAQVGAPFDYRFRYSDDGALYCTELVLKALAHAGIDLAETLQPVRVMTVDEPAFAPDALRQSGELQEMLASVP